MQNKYLSALKTKYASLGLSKEALDRVASQRVKTIANEDEIDGDIASFDTALLVMKELQGSADSHRTRAAQIQKELDQLKDGKKEEPADNPFASELTELKALVTGMATKIAENERRTREESIRSAVEAKMESLGCTNAYIRGIVVKQMTIGESDTAETLAEKCKAEYDSGCRAAFGDGYVPPKGGGGANDKPDFSAMVAELKASGDLPK